MINVVILSSLMCGVILMLLYSIAQLCVDGYIDKEEAILRSNNRSKMEKSLDYARRA